VEPWVEVAEIPDLRFTLDTSRIEAADDYLSVWLRFDWRADQFLPDSSRYRTSQIRQEIKCSERVSRTRDMNAYMPGADSMSFLSFPEPAWAPFEQQPLKAIYSEGACLLLQRMNRLPPA